MNEEKNNNEHRYLPALTGNQKKLRKSNKNKIMFGVCGGIAEYLGIDAAVIRLIFVLTVLIGGWGIISYFIAALLMPSSVELLSLDFNSVKIIEENNRRVILGSLLILTGFYFTFNFYGIIDYLSVFGFEPELYWAITFMAVGVYTFVNRDSLRKSQTAKKVFVRSRSDRRFMGVCGGMADYFNADSNLIRMSWLISAFITLGLSLVIYMLIPAIIPLEED